jgi:DNA polymerase-2
MNEIVGWLLDIYADSKDGVVLWLLGEDGKRHRLRHWLPITFYATGPEKRLRQLWCYLQSQPVPVNLERTQREDLFAGMRTVLAVQVPNAAAQEGLFQEAARFFPDLDYYDADVPLALRYGAAYEIFPMARCQARVDSEDRLNEITSLDARWELDPLLPPLRVLTIEADVDPAHASPTYLDLHCGRAGYHLALDNERVLLINLNAILKSHDPDLILTRRGDTWLFPRIFELAQRCGIPFNPNRDPQRQVLQRKERSYFTYGQVVYRGHQVHLYGRWHIDETNAMMYGDYGLEGVLEQARLTGLPVQEVARKSPGSGITAMQMQTALRRGVLIPYQKQQAESYKSAKTLIEADFGGLVYQPLIGLHEDVAEIDFISMYPSIMAHFNLSPETVGFDGDDTQPVPELGIEVDQGRSGLVPETLRPLLERRLELKKRLAELSPHDCRYKPYKARAQALKWLLVVCFGYLGYKNARFGRIESHQAVTAYSREILLRAKEVAEGMGLTVLHMYVDGLWVRKTGLSKASDFQSLVEAIAEDTHLHITLEGVYRWIVFLPSRQDERVPVPNRYFGVFQDGSLKMRGIEARRRDTPPWISEIQLEILYCLAQAPNASALPDCLPGILSMLRQRVADLRCGRVPLDQLLVSLGLSRELGEYCTPSPAARAAAQLEAIGKHVRPGQRIRFLYTLGEPGVYAWDLAAAPDPRTVDVKRYRTLLLRAAASVLQPLGIGEEKLKVLLLAHSTGNLPLWPKPRGVTEKRRAWSSDSMSARPTPTNPMQK